MSNMTNNKLVAEIGFHSGILAALAVVAAADEETLYHAIVGTVDSKKLIGFSQIEDSIERSGLAKYGYVKA